MYNKQIQNNSWLSAIYLNFVFFIFVVMYNKKKIYFYKFAKRATFALIIVIVLLYIWGDNVNFEKRFAPVIYSKEGKIMSAGISEDQQWRIACENKMPDKLATSIRLFEDQYFYYHPGVNIGSILKAIKNNINAGHIVRGGSTITMQLARIYYGNRKRTYWQKIKEILLSFALELRFSKDKILNLYGQYAPFGGNIIGYDAASRFYYDKKPGLLSWSEAVTLAVLPNAPSDIYPGKGQRVLLEKRDRLLKKLLDKSIIDSLTYRLSLRENVPVRKNNFPDLTPHLLPLLSGTNTKTNSYITTIDYSLQKEASRVINRYNKRYSSLGIDNMAVLILRNDGTVASYVANTNCQSKECGSKVDIIRSERSPGSILKPFLYGACLDAGIITRRSLLMDIPSFYNGFSPKNYDRKFRGIVRVDKALTQSLNVPAVNLLAKYGIDAFLSDLKKLKIAHSAKTADYYGLSLILGGSEVRMWDIGRAYMNMVRVAMKKKPIDITLTKGEKNKILDDDFPISTAASWQILDMLKGVNRPEEQDGWQYFSGQHSISWKTGTSYGYRDAWSVGVTKDYTVVIWVGNADGEGRKGLTGIKKAAPVLFSVFDLLPISEKTEEPLNAFKPKKVCKASGYTSTGACEKEVIAFVPKNSHNLPLCKFHKLLTVDETGKYLVPPNCNVKNAGQKSFFILNPIANSYFKKFKGKEFLYPPVFPGCETVKSKIGIIYPPENAEILLPKDIDNTKRKLICSASTSSDVDSLYWFLDNEIISITKESHKVVVNADTGVHKITILAPTGTSITHTFKIITNKS